MTKSQSGSPVQMSGTSKVKLHASRLVDRAILGVRSALHVGETMRSNGTEISLTPGHSLQVYQKSHPLYDRFLPYLAHHLQAPDLVVDVGANCGDTLAGMHAANPGLEFVAVEPDQQFFALLEQNSARLEASPAGLKAHLVQSLVGQNVAGATLVGSKGTKKAVVGASGGQTHQSRTLDEILETLGIASIRLLKSDVDGFDFDVINSAQKTLATSHPLVFFESQIDHDFQREGFAATLAMLETLGYGYWVLFDNFGSPVLRTADTAAAKQLIEYPWKKRHVTPWPTIYYCDVLAVTAADRPFVDAVVDAYERDAGDYRLAPLAQDG